MSLLDWSARSLPPVSARVSLPNAPSFSAAASVKVLEALRDATSRS